MQSCLRRTFTKMNVYICLTVLFEVSSIFALSVLTGSESKNMTYSDETVREVKNFDVLRQLLNQETLIRMSMAKDMLSLKQSFVGDMSTLKQTIVEFKKDLQKLKRENERLSNENVKYSEMSDKMNKTLHILHNKFEQSKQSFLGEMSTLKQTTTELKMDLRLLKQENERLSNENVKCSENVNLVLGNSDEMNKTIDKLRDELKQSKQKLSSAVSSLKILQTNSRDQEMQVGFTAGVTYRDDNFKGSTIIFPKVVYNEGGGYDSSTGRFTAPVSGHFVFFTTSHSANNHLETDIVLDGTSKVRTEAYNMGGAEYQTGTNMVLMNLRKGNKVWVKRAAGKGYYSESVPIMTFSGFKI